MTLQYTVASLDAVNEEHKPLYTEKDGAFVLDVSGIPEPEDTSGLKSALVKERKAVKDLRGELAAFKSVGETPEEIEAAIEAAKESTDGKSVTDTKEYQLLQSKVEALTKKNDELQTGIEQAKTSAAGTIRDAHIASALADAKATKAGMRLLRKELASRVKVTLNDGEQPHIEIVQTDGETPMVGSAEDGSATIADLVAKDAKEQFPELFEGTGAGGSGKQPGSAGGGSSSKTMSRDAFEKMSPSERATKMQDGFTLTDD